MRPNARTPRPRQSTAVPAPRTPVLVDAIEIRGARQNNLKGVDLDLPLNQLIVVTGPSGSGKSSLAFQTIYAEGQRRYVETFSPYVRQFFDRMDKPQVDEIRGIPPAIAIEQANNVKTTRSTVGTITEINDYLKLLFPRIAEGRCPSCHGPVQPDTPSAIAAAAKSRWNDAPVLITFGVSAPPKTATADFFSFLQSQGYVRVFIYGEIFRTDQPESFTRALPARIDVIQDRVPANRRSRLLESVETALHLGKGKLALIDPVSGERLDFSSAWHCAKCDSAIRPPVAGLFSFNHALGACRACRGFGRVIGIDYQRALPDHSLSIGAGVVKAFQGDTYQECQIDLERNARKRKIDLDTPFEDLSDADQEWVIRGEGGDPEAAYESGRWYGVKGFFDWLETKTYKMHVRVFLSRFRSYTECRVCEGRRLQPEALNYRIGDRTLPDLWHLPVGELLPFIRALKVPANDSSAKLLRDEIVARLGYLEEVGLSYLDLDRPTRTLSGGEVQRVNLTTCLGASLTNTLFVLDEPSIGLHPRDIGRLIGVMERLRDKENTLLVVEHEESVIRAADHLVDVGPGRGDEGGEIVFSGPAANLEGSSGPSLTRDYLTGAKSIPVPEKRRSGKERLRILGARQHNLQRIDVDIPLGIFCCITGVSGSGKSTLVHHVLYENLLRAKGESSEGEPGRLKELRGAEKIDRVVMVDQSPLSRTPRSTPALYIGVFENIRKLFSSTLDATARGFTPGFFSFNSGAGRCERCWGNGYEKVEMQFLSDVFVRCPECEGTRYTKDALEIKLHGQSIHEILEMTVDRAIAFFSDPEFVKSTQARNVVSALTVLQDVGLGYLRLGQPLNTLSGGESQRLKLVGHLLEHRPSSGEVRRKTNLLIFDEPTTGLHFDDIAMLMKVFHRLVDSGESILVIEHNVDVIRSADWVIDLGPEAGTGGGQIVAVGTPEQIASVRHSHTGAALRGETGTSPLQIKEAANARHVLADRRSIVITGAREHNLKDISLEIPRDQFVVLSGLSGSGKSTLAFDILFAEGQRRFLDSMSTYARQFVEQMEKPDVDHVTGLPPTVAIEQRISRGGGKSTVATVTEVYHFLRLLFAKTGTQHSPATGKPVIAQSVTEIVSRLRTIAKTGEVTVLAPLIKARKGYHTEVAEWALRHGYETLLVDGAFQASAGFQRLERFKEHTIDAVIGRIQPSTPLTEARALIETALKLGKQTARYLDSSGQLHVASTRLSCPESGVSFEELDPRLFSYNSPHGWCPVCRGYGEVQVHPAVKPEGDESMLQAELREERARLHGDAEELTRCPECGGARLNLVARHVKVLGHSIDQIARLSVADARTMIQSFRFEAEQARITRDILPEIVQRLRFMEEVGLGYLQLDRSAQTLSGGESQRIRLAAQLGSNLRGVLYVLDEPTIGLHPRDNVKLLDTLAALRDKGNSLLIVEHDEETMRRADHLIDLGPGAGRLGGKIAFSGPFHKLLEDGESYPDSPTAAMLRNPLSHPIRGQRRPMPADDQWLAVTGARANNLRNLEVRIPIGRLTGICGISGSGKSSFMRAVLQPAVKSLLEKHSVEPSVITWDRITGVDRIGAVYEVDQSPIGKTSRSTPGTYIKVFDDIRKLYAQVPDSRARGYTAGRFSFNSAGGRCETCQGNGQIKLEMTFLPSAYVPCDDCQGMRYNAATLEILYQGKNIGEVMQMSIDEAAAFFQASPRIARCLTLLRDTGLGYLQIGQPSPTLSGGEAQRIKLVSELTRGVNRSENSRLRRNIIEKSHLYLIEEPSIGLHKADVVRLLDVLHRLVDDGATVVVIEHNLEILAEADHVIEIGPEAGAEGGQLVASGTPEAVSRVKGSRTAPFLREILRGAPGGARR